MATKVGRSLYPANGINLQPVLDAVHKISPSADRPCFQDYLRCVAWASGDGWHNLAGGPTAAKGWGGLPRMERYEASNRLAEVYKSGWAVSKAAMGEESGIVGGYTVPLDYSLALMESIAEASFIYPRAHHVPMLAAETYCPKIDVETVPPKAGVTPFFGGVVFKWGSSQAPAETEPTFRQLSLKAWDLLGYATVSNQWLGDTGPQGEEALIKLFGKAAAWYAEYAFLQGTGTAQQMPLGIIPWAQAAGNSGALVTRGSGAGMTTIAAADIATMTETLLPFSWPNAIWACSPTVKAQLVKLSTYFLNATGLEPDGRHYSLDGRPGFVTEKLPALGGTGDLVLFDPWLYVVGVRQEVLIDVSPHSAFQNNQTDFRVWLRMDGKPQVSKPVTIQDTTTVVSPYVILK